MHTAAIRQDLIPTFATEIPMQNSRRSFLITGAGIASTIGLSRAAFAQAPARLAESDPQAQALGYRDDNTKVDKAKYATYAVGHSCSTCALYQGTAGSAAGPCPIFSGKTVAATGWCSAYSKKA
jgi:hypothetical protein